MRAQHTGRSVAGRSNPRGAGSVDRNLEILSRLMDSAFEVPGLRWRFGLDAVVGLVPGIGDLLSGGVAFYIIAVAAIRYRLPAITLVRMGLNLAIDLVVGAIPVVGDLFDVWWKVNERNIELIRRRSTASDVNARTATGRDLAFVSLTIGGVLALICGMMLLLWHLVTNLIAWLRV